MSLSFKWWTSNIVFIRWKYVYIFLHLGCFRCCISYIWKSCRSYELENENMLQHWPRRRVKHGRKLWRHRWPSILLFGRGLDMRRDDNIYDVFTWNSTKVGIVKSTNYRFITLSNLFLFKKSKFTQTRSILYFFSGDSCLGGLFAVLCFYYNHGEATRVQWTPPLRESFAFPISFMQQWMLTRILSSTNDDSSNRFKVI